MEIVGKLKRKSRPQVWKVELVIRTGSPQFRTQVEAALEAGCFEEFDAIASSTIVGFYEDTLPVFGEQHRLALEPPSIIADYGLRLETMLDGFRRTRSDLETRLEAVVAKNPSFSLAGTLDEEVYYTWNCEDEPVSTDDLIAEFHSEAREDHYRSHEDPMGVDYIRRGKEWQNEKKSHADTGGEPPPMPEVIPENYSKWVF